MGKKETIRVLHIEDDKASRTLVRKLLDHPPFQLYEAATGLEGLQLARAALPMLIIMDLNLPDISGAELATKIKSLPELKQTVIIALTGVKDPYTRDISLVSGCDGFLSKPIDTDQFEQGIREFLEGKRELIEEHRKAGVQQRFQEALVDHLTIKIQQLQSANQLLNKRGGQLRTYSKKLETLLEVLHNLQMCQSTSELKAVLVEEICCKLEFRRCVFLDINHDLMKLEVRHSHGVDKQKWGKLSLPYEMPVFLDLFRDHPVRFFSSPRKVNDRTISATLETLGVQQFAFGMLAVPLQQNSWAEIRSENDLVPDTMPSLIDRNDVDRSIIEEHLREYVSSNLYDLGGYLFIDNHRSEHKFTRYDLKILEMLLNSAGFLYQNLRMRSQLKSLFVRAETEAITDFLTNLFNYRFFSQQLSREVDRARRHASPLVLLMLDIDHFKRYNDTFGHQAGDVVLKKVAALLRQNTRSSDIVARYGGEEFAIICPEVNMEEGKRIAEKLCEIVAQTSFAGQERMPRKKLTISIGVAVYQDYLTSPKELVLQADKALYAAKEGGRNQVRVFEESRRR